jgi:hypothetical protein
MGSSSTKPVAATQVRKSPVALGPDRGGAIAPYDDDLTFALEDPTNAGLAALPNQEVVAVPHGARVAVESQAQILGWVPDRFAERIRGERQGSAYLGRVIEVDRAKRRVVVTLVRRQQLG